MSKIIEIRIWNRSKTTRSQTPDDGCKCHWNAFSGGYKTPVGFIICTKVPECTKGRYKAISTSRRG
eukprot:UC4_evm3s347